MRQSLSSVSPETRTDQPGWQTTGGDMARYGARADRALTAGAHASGVAKARRESRAQAQGGSLPAAGSRAEAASMSAVEISHLRKTYGPLVAVDDVSFSVAEGEIFGILGPNGAGKTTTVECAIGLRSPDSGTIRLMGVDPQADKAQDPRDHRSATAVGRLSGQAAGRRDHRHVPVLLSPSGRRGRAGRGARPGR